MGSFFFDRLQYVYMNKAEQFFHDIASKCIEHVEKSLENNTIAVHKHIAGDYATELDISVENLIVAELQTRFPDDEILAEEGYADTSIGEDRIWVIDPICGTTNLGRSINTYCTNIALVENRQIIAACVVDYSQNEYVWSVGSGVYIGEKDPISIKHRDNARVIDVDYGAVMKASEAIKQQYGAVVTDITREQAWMVSSMNSSLSFAYVCMRKIDAAMCVSYNPWDAFASVFLVQQMGGIVTDYDGNDWTVDSRSFVMAMDAAVHERIMSAIKSS